MRKYSSFIAPNGINLRSERSIMPERLSTALQATVHFLQEIELPGAVLHKYDDWWEHDGLHFDAGNVDFGRLSRMVESPSAMKASMPGDFSVYVGVAPQNFRWYLRFLYDVDADVQDEDGRFDLTLPQDLIAPYRQQVLMPLSMMVTEQEALSYYRAIGMDAWKTQVMLRTTRIKGLRPDCVRTLPTSHPTRSSLREE